MPGRASTEADPLPTDGPVGGRGRAVTARAGLAVARASAARPCACRAPSTTTATGGFAGLLTGIARRTGVSGYPGDGTQRWPAVHALDAAVLFRLALEQAPAGTAWHAVADEGDAVRDIAAVIGRRLGLPVESVPEETFGPLGADLRDGPALVERPHPRGARLGADAPEPAGGPGAHPTLTAGRLSVGMAGCSDMTTIVLIHSVLGLRQGVSDAAERLRAAGHEVHTPDLLDGAVFDTYDPAMANWQPQGDEINERALAAVADLPDGFVVGGFSAGSGVATFVATRRAVSGLLQLSGENPLEWFGDDAAFPPGMDSQIHQMATTRSTTGPRCSRRRCATSRRPVGAARTSSTRVGPPVHRPVAARRVRRRGHRAALVAGAAVRRSPRLTS